MNYIPVIGLEIHAELNTKSKMFCSCPNNPFDSPPNANVCPVCLGHPGTLPTANKEAIMKTAKVGVALRCTIARHSKFDRKNYFYPDLPKGYQISQYDLPLCANGFLEVQGRKISVRRIHIEEDTGKLVHPPGASYSLVDFNRSGVPLLELVTEPDVQSGVEAREFAKELQLILRVLQVSEADMEKGQMRVEVNISLKEEHALGLGTKVEIKNLNSFRAVEDSIAYEIARQTGVLEKGGEVGQETRGWDQQRGETYPQREKESAHDYRYFPEPDIPPIEFSEETIREIEETIPELPRTKRLRFKTEYAIGDKAIEIFTNDKELGEYFEQAASEHDPNVPAERLAKRTALIANYLISDVKGYMEEHAISAERLKMTPENFAELMGLLETGAITSSVAKALLPRMIEEGIDPTHIIGAEGLEQVGDEKTVRNIAKKIIAEHPKAVEDYKKGKTNALQFLAGKVIAQTRGTADPTLVRNILDQELA